MWIESFISNWILQCETQQKLFVSIQFSGTTSEFTSADERVSSIISAHFQILYGRNWYKNSLKNFRYQMSPLMTELLIPSPEPIDDVLMIGVDKYLGLVDFC